jgi:2-dehydro-3-deoxy-D-arabinonate dehydratase
MNTPQLIRYHDARSGAQTGVLLNGKIHIIPDLSIADWLRSTTGRVDEAIRQLLDLAASQPAGPAAASLDNAPADGVSYWLPPIDQQEVWASGVTYLRSREARQEEAQDGGDIYARVYDAERPELFFKATRKNTVGHLDQVGIRADAHWNVPEPELGLVLNPAMEMVGFTVGNDMSSRDIEGANPLYLPQAKVYTASCGLGGPGIALNPADEWPDTHLRITISRDNQEAFSGEIHTRQIKRDLLELVTYLGRSNTFPDGVILLTGTGIVPGGDFTLRAGDIVRITIDGIGMLQNTVRVV